MNKRKMWWERFEESLKEPKVIEFMEQMKNIGAAGGPRVNCFVYHKDDIVLVANYRPVDGAIIGAVLTTGAFDEMMIDSREASSSLPLGYFAWAYRYGYDFLENGMDAVAAFKYATNQGPTGSMDMTGRYYEDIVYIVREYVDAKAPGEYGVDDSFNLVGIFNDIDTAEAVAADVLKEEPRRINDTINAKHDVTIIPAYMNRKYEGYRPALGGSWYIE